MNYLRHCLEHLARIYEKRNHNNRKIKFVLVGHSIGGIIASALSARPDFDRSKIDLILTLSTPHKKPVVNFDYALITFYEALHENLHRLRTNGNNSLTTVSISGGFNDILVNSHLTEIDDNFDYNFVSTAISDVWVQSDHLSIVWCRQLVIKLNRLLFDYINPSIPNKRNVINYHMNSAARGKYYPNYIIPNNLIFPQNFGNWHEFVKRCQRFSSKAKLLESQFVLVSLVEGTTVVIQVDGEVKYDWIAACNVTGRFKKNNRNMKYCEDGQNLAPMTKVFPPGSSNVGHYKRVFKGSADNLIKAGYSHLNVWLNPNNSSVSDLNWYGCLFGFFRSTC